MSSTHSYFDTVTNWPTTIKSLLENSAYWVKFTGESGGVFYENKFAVSDLAVRFSNEITDPADSSDVFTLSSPLCILYIQPLTRGKIRAVSGMLNVEFQIVVNSEPQGMLNLDGYTTLMRSLCDPERNKSFWMGKGLAPRIVNEGTTIKGSELLERLEGRIFLRSIITRFDMIGENVYANR